jgi:hypothetical protein
MNPKRQQDIFDKIDEILSEDNPNITQLIKEYNKLPNEVKQSRITNDILSGKVGPDLTAGNRFSNVYFSRENFEKLIDVGVYLNTNSTSAIRDAFLNNKIQIKNGYVLDEKHIKAFFVSGMDKVLQHQFETDFDNVIFYMMNRLKVDFAVKEKLDNAFIKADIDFEKIETDGSYELVGIENFLTGLELTLFIKAPEKFISLLEKYRESDLYSESRKKVIYHKFLAYSVFQNISIDDYFDDKIAEYKEKFLNLEPITDNDYGYTIITGFSNHFADEVKDKLVTQKHIDLLYDYKNVIRGYPENLLIGKFDSGLKLEVKNLGSRSLLEFIKNGYLSKFARKIETLDFTGAEEMELVVDFFIAAQNSGGYQFVLEDKMKKYLFEKLRDDSDIKDYPQLMRMLQPKPSKNSTRKLI